MVKNSVFLRVNFIVVLTTDLIDLVKRAYTTKDHQLSDSKLVRSINRPIHSVDHYRFGFRCHWVCIHLSDPVKSDYVYLLYFLGLMS